MPTRVPKQRTTVQVMQAKGWRGAYVTNVDSATQLDLLIPSTGEVLLNSVKQTKNAKVLNRWRFA